MAKAQDPVCGMKVKIEETTLTAMHEGQTYYFCADECRKAFMSEPAKYTKEPANEPFLKAGSIPTPKFGSAGSGGAEYEPGPSGQTVGKRR